MRTNTATMLKSTLFALLLLPLAAMAAPYIITGSDTSFTATKDGENVAEAANQPIQDVIDAIKADAAGIDSEIQFGNGEEELDIGTASINFNGSGVGWNATLSGKITSSGAGNSNAISLTNGANVESKADIKNIKNIIGNAIRNDGTGTLTISGGTISATNYAVYNNSTGTVNITGGAITATNYAVYNNSTGTVNITGGAITTTNATVSNAAAGKITVSGTANITSANTSATGGTVHITNSGTATEARLEITGGTITNTAGGNAVYNASTGSVSLGKSPAINGKIYKTATAGNLSVITEGENAFAPEQTYTLGFPFPYIPNAMAVLNGKDFLANFELADDDWELVTSGNDIVIAYIGPEKNYIITANSTTQFTATKDGTQVGTTAAIQAVINAIKSDANGSPCEIQFGDGEEELGIGAANINFDGSGVGWNATLTLTGKITSSSNSQAGIYLTNGANVESKADIKNIIGSAIRNDGTGTLTISGGTISATDYAVENRSTGTVNITDGTITSTDYYAVYNSSTGTVNISGGTIPATTNAAVLNGVAGKITVSGTANITSANTSATEGTVFISFSGSATATRLEITGGTITNTAGGNAIFNNSTGSVSLGKNPAITGNIRKTGNGNLSVITEGENAFAPEQTYTLDFATYTANAVAAAGGKDYLANFITANANWDVIASGSDAVLANANIVVTVENGTGSRKYAAGGEAMIAADEAPEGQRFKEWQITPEVDFLNSTSKTSPTAIFTVPDEDVEATAVFENVYTLIVTNGTGSGEYAAGEEVTIAASTPEEGQRFKEWNVVSGSVTIVDNKFAMPAMNVSIAANYEDIFYNIAVSSSEGGTATANEESAIMGTEITLTATANTGYRFKEWEVVSGGITIADNKFTMPASDVEVKAVFEAKTQQELCEEAGSHWIGGVCKTDAELLEEEIAACVAEGKVWENGACRAKTEQEVCAETDGSHWIDGACKSDDDILAEQIAACEESGNVWENDECKTITTPTRHPQIASGNIRAYAANRNIVLENLPKDAKVEVYSLQGKRIYSANSENSQILKILIQTKGVYIAKIGTQIFRVAVK